MKLKTPLFKLGDKIFLVEDNTLITWYRGEVGCFPRTTSEEDKVTYLPTSEFELSEGLDFSSYYNKNSYLHNSGEFTEDGMMYAIHKEVDGLDTIYYVMYLPLLDYYLKLLVSENEMVKVKTPLFKGGDKVFLVQNNVVNKIAGKITFLPSPNKFESSPITSFQRHEVEFSEDGRVYAYHFLEDIKYNVLFEKGVKYPNTDNELPRQVQLVNESDLVKHPAYDVIGRATHDFLSRNKTNRMKTLDDKAYLPDEMKDHISSFLPPPLAKESLASHVNNRITHTRRAAIRKSRKEPQPETDSEWWYDKWFNFDSDEHHTNANLEPKNDSTNYTKLKFTPSTASMWWYNLSNKKKPINSRNGGTRKVRKTSKKKRVKK